MCYLGLGSAAMAAVAPALGHRGTRPLPRRQALAGAALRLPRPPPMPPRGARQAHAGPALRGDAARPAAERRGPLAVVFAATHGIQASILFATPVIILVTTPSGARLSLHALAE